MDKQKRGNPPSIRQIVAYWEAREAECGLGVDWAEAHERCWRCGYESHLERCHIVPHSLGGKNIVSNYVLLCSACHAEAPNIADPRFMWRWLRATCVPFYDTFWLMRAVREFEDVYGRKSFELPNFGKQESQQAILELKDLLNKATIHFGQPDLNASTLACLYALAEERVTGSLPDAAKSSRNHDYLLEAMGWKKRQES